MAEQKEDFVGELQSIKNEILLAVGEKIDKNFRWIIAVYLGTFIPAMVAVFALILTIESNNNKSVSALQAGLERVSVQVNLMAQSFSYELKKPSDKSATTEEQKAPAVTEEPPQDDQKPKTAKLIN